ncbi:MAG: TyeA family type III secretion system gatekeeper subunit [Puniceicoccales bacterium]|jgi:type III secretion system TyeA family effector delivery regulator|nr:TyeA family type III secretion system gatekeeper subunit [Puniceicoccales bacterium]
MFTATQIPELSLLMTKTLMQAAFREWIDSKQLAQLMSQLSIATNQEKMYFLTSLSLTIRKYPDALFPKPDVRTNILQVVQECLDECVLEDNT